jgi:hypothetical protein
MTKKVLGGAVLEVIERQLDKNSQLHTSLPIFL